MVDFSKVRSSLGGESDKTVEFEKVKKAREHVQKIKMLSLKTEQDYTRKYARFKSDDKDVNLGEKSGTSRSFYANRAGFIHGARCELKTLLYERDKAVKKGDKDSASQCFQRIDVILQQLDYWTPQDVVLDPENQANARGLGRAIGEHVAPSFSELKQSGKTKASESNSKISDAAKWSKKGFHDVWEILKDGKFKDWAALSVTTGIRPEELPRAEIIDNSGNTLSIRIHGAKSNDHHGQRFRDITLITTGDNEVAACARHLAGLPLGPIPTPDGKDPYEAFRKQLARVGQKVWPKNGPTLSPYVFRHALTADMKADGVDREIIAKVLGHSVTETAAIYGQANTGRKGIRQVDAIAEKFVKVNHAPNIQKPAPTVTTPGTKAETEPDDFEW